MTRVLGVILSLCNICCLILNVFITHNYWIVPINVFTLICSLTMVVED